MEEEESEVQEEEMAVHEEEASEPIIPVIRPPERLTYDVLGESSEEVILASQKTLDTPNLSITDLVEGDSNSSPGTSKWAIPIMCGL